MGTTKSLVERVPGTLSAGVRRPRREADDSPASSDVCLIKQMGVRGGGGGVSDGSGLSPS
jgi:hypothetical protein